MDTAKPVSAEETLEEILIRNGFTRGRDVFDEDTGDRRASFSLSLNLTKPEEPADGQDLS